METKRTFIAIDFRLHPEMEELIGRLRKEFHGEQMKWVDPDQLHLTLRFLGNTTVEQVESISKGLEALAGQFSSFNVRVIGLGLFLKNGFPTILWTGMELPDQFQVFTKAVEELAVEAGFEPESKPFKAHLTLCRIKSIRQREKLKGIIEKNRETLFFEETIGEVIFYESILRPQGPLYRPINVIPFGNV